MISGKSEQMFGRQVALPQRLSSDPKEGYEQRLGHILAAACGVIARLGYERASMRAVAKATGVSLSGLYHYFDSKEKMLFLIQFRTFSALHQNLIEKLHGVVDPEEQLRVMIRAHLGYFAANMDALKVCSHELDTLSGPAYEETRDIRKEYYALIRSIIERLLDAHSPGASVNRHVLTMSLFGTLNWLYRWYDPVSGPSVATVSNQIATQFLHGIYHLAGSADQAATVSHGSPHEALQGAARTP
jgi:AcrR family transcriptional regulator